MLNLNSPTVLLIDNYEGLVKAVSTRLQSEGVRCLTAASGSQGFSLFDEESIDIVVTDLMMPNGGGVELVNAIRRKSDVPIIVTTGYQDTYQFELQGISGLSLIQKPFNWRYLLECIYIEIALHSTASCGSCELHPQR